MLATKADLAWTAHCYSIQQYSLEECEKSKLFPQSLTFPVSKVTFSFANINIRSFTTLATQLKTHFRLVKFPDAIGGWVALSYYQKWSNSVEKLFFKTLDFYIKYLETSNKKLNYSDFAFTGFGESSPYAVFAALEFVKKYKPEKSPIVVTFGQLKMGNDIFVAFAQLQLRIFRVTYKDDWSPSLPFNGIRTFSKWSDDIERPANSFPLLYEEYKHFKPEFWIEGDNCECSENSYPILYKCLNSVSYAEHPECNARKHDHKMSSELLKNGKSDEFRYGPYFGRNLNNCENIKRVPIIQEKRSRGRPPRYLT
ncbi:hypothetical protein G9A89_010566 [Geosiphon pyriformis]|nr:hypothetical protein G9A89_010566 [Geosiphon pyriformis]